MTQSTTYAIQMHITFSEITTLLTSLVACASAHVTVVALEKKPQILTSVEDLKEADVLSSEPSWLAVTPKKPVLARVQQGIDFVARNDDYALFTFLGNKKKNVLMESFFEMRLRSDVPNRKCWLAFKKEMLKILPTGAWVWSNDGEFRRFDKSRRVSSGARQFWAEGGDLRLLNLHQVDTEERSFWKRSI